MNVNANLLLSAAKSDTSYDYPLAQVFFTCADKMYLCPCW